MLNIEYEFIKNTNSKCLVKIKKDKNISNLIDKSIYFENYLNECFLIMDTLTKKAHASIFELNKHFCILRNLKLLDFECLLNLKGSVIFTVNSLEKLEKFLFLEINTNNSNLEAIYTIQGFSILLKEFLLNLNVLIDKVAKHKITNNLVF